MLDIDVERRFGARVNLSRKCKVFDPRSRRYIAGTTCDVGPGGMKLRLDRGSPFDRGDTVYIGIAPKRRVALIAADDLIEAKVVRSLRLTTGELAVAVSFVDDESQDAGVVEMAA